MFCLFLIGIGQVETMALGLQTAMCNASDFSFESSFCSVGSTFQLKAWSGFPLKCIVSSDCLVYNCGISYSGESGRNFQVRVKGDNKTMKNFGAHLSKRATWPEDVVQRIGGYRGNRRECHDPSGDIRPIRVTVLPVRHPLPLDHAPHEDHLQREDI